MYGYYREMLHVNPLWSQRVNDLFQSTIGSGNILGNQLISFLLQPDVLFSFVTGRSRNKRSQFARERTCYSETKAQSEPQGRGIEGQCYSCLTEGNLRDDTYSEFC